MPDFFIFYELCQNTGDFSTCRVSVIRSNFKLRDKGILLIFLNNF